MQKPPLLVSSRSGTDDMITDATVTDEMVTDVNGADSQRIAKVARVGPGRSVGTMAGSSSSSFDSSLDSLEAF